MTTEQVDAFAKYQLALEKSEILQLRGEKLLAAACIALFLAPLLGSISAALGMVLLIVGLTVFGMSEHKATELAELEYRALYPRRAPRRNIKLPPRSIYR